MNLNDVSNEYEMNGRLSQRSIQRVREALGSGDPYEAITLAGDCAVLELAKEIALCLDSSDPMVRWNATGVLYTRFRTPERIEKLIELAANDQNTMVRAIALCGLGETLPRINDVSLRRRVASLLFSSFNNDRLYDELRAAAYDGILAALDVLPLQRPPANKPLSPSDIDPARIGDFRARYLSDCVQ